MIDSRLNQHGRAFTVIANTEQIAAGSRDRVAQPIGFRVPIQRAPDGTAYLEIRGLAPCEVLVLTHHP